jgi:hypothetical protein
MRMQLPPSPSSACLSACLLDCLPVCLLDCLALHVQRGWYVVRSKSSLLLSRVRTPRLCWSAGCSTWRRTSRCGLTGAFSKWGLLRRGGCWYSTLVHTCELIACSPCPCRVCLACWQCCGGLLGGGGAPAHEWCPSPTHTVPHGLGVSAASSGIVSCSLCAPCACLVVGARRGCPVPGRKRVLRKSKARFRPSSAKSRPACPSYP